MPTARNDAEVKAMLTPALIEAARYVAQKIYEDNQAVVMNVVYGVGSGSERTHDLLRAWDVKAYGGGGHARGEFKFNPDKMDSHESWIGQGSVKEELIDIVYQGLAGDFGIGNVDEYDRGHKGKRYAHNNPIFWNRHWANARNAWAELCHQIGKQKIREYIERGFSNAGLRWKRRGGSIGMEVYDNK